MWPDTVFVSSIVFAAESPWQTLYNSSSDFLTLLMVFIGILLTVVIIYFIINIIKMINAEKERSEEIKKVIWSVVAIAILVSLWGLVSFLNTITIDESGGVGKFGFDIEIPQATIGGGGGTVVETPGGGTVVETPGGGTVVETPGGGTVGPFGYY